MVTLDDELFVRFASFMRGLLRWWCGPQREVPSSMVRAVVALAQFRAERYNRAIRLQTVRQDKQRMQSLAFTGRQT